mmetsp:Transcript_17142/g.42878  ORF Transcript_17142/g.42878 Transcript_17142/m.42878 type:complete len:202 (-) Transcript_17142:289-894(-)
MRRPFCPRHLDRLGMDKLRTRLVPAEWHLHGLPACLWGRGLDARGRSDVEPSRGRGGFEERRRERCRHRPPHGRPELFAFSARPGLELGGLCRRFAGSRRRGRGGCRRRRRRRWRPRLGVCRHGGVRPGLQRRGGRRWALRPARGGSSAAGSWLAVLTSSCWQTMRCLRTTCELYSFVFVHLAITEVGPKVIPLCAHFDEP